MKNIVLIGMSGAGKSTLGVLLAKALGMDFIDTDIIIQQREGRLLQQIIDYDGTDKFLETEAETILGLDVRNCVIATGGSVVYSEPAMRALKKRGVTVYLYAEFEEIKRRLADIKTRGIVIHDKASLYDIYTERLPLYEKYADIKIDCTGRRIEETVEYLVREIRRISGAPAEKARKRKFGSGNEC
ncbi:MAG TPA: shikimate kinase [Clostridiales bacterium]|jgi:shikimate kinase|nr:shikimate kinase [Clostridiales bacterium]